MGAQPAGRSSSRLAQMLTPRRIVALGLAVLTLVFVLQNRDDASFQLLGFQVIGPLWFASLALLGMGIAIGVLIGSRSPRDDGR